MGQTRDDEVWGHSCLDRRVVQIYIVASRELTILGASIIIALVVGVLLPALVARQLVGTPQIRFEVF